MNKLLNIIICILLGLFLGVFLVWPKYQEVKSLGAVVEKKQLEFQYRGEYFAGLEKLSGQLAKYQEGLSKIDSALPLEPSLPSLLRFLQKTASENGLILTSVGFTLPASLKESQESSAPKAFQGIKFSLALSGSYPAFKNFLYSLEGSSRLWEPESFSLSSAGAKEKRAEKGETLSFDLQVKTYTY